jgi:hypothetical protein
MQLAAMLGLAVSWRRVYSGRNRHVIKFAEQGDAAAGSGSGALRNRESNPFPDDGIHRVRAEDSGTELKAFASFERGSISPSARLRVECAPRTAQIWFGIGACRESFRFHLFAFNA